MNPTQEELRRAKEAIIALLSIALVVEINAILTFYFIGPDNSAFIPIIITFVLAFIVVIISLFLYKKQFLKKIDQYLVLNGLSLYTPFYLLFLYLYGQLF
jgi:membrane protein YdbS with pleckstrin-like domain